MLVGVGKVLKSPMVGAETYNNAAGFCSLFLSCSGFSHTESSEGFSGTVFFLLFFFLSFTQIVSPVSAHAEAYIYFSGIVEMVFSDF